MVILIPKSQMEAPPSSVSSFAATTATSYPLSHESHNSSGEALSLFLSNSKPKLTPVRDSWSLSSPSSPITTHSKGPTCISSKRRARLGRDFQTARRNRDSWCLLATRSGSEFKIKRGFESINTGH